MCKIIYKRGLLLAAFLMLFGYSFSQKKDNQTKINNLQHIQGYKTSNLGDIPAYTKSGNGSQTLILIPGLGFDASVFSDFMEANKNKYTMYAITIPGFGKTQAPPMPDTSLSYGDQTWSKGAIQGIFKLIDKEKIHKPVLLGHFTIGTQLALRIAIDYPDSISGVITLGGQPKFISIQDGESFDYPLKTLIAVADKYTGPVMFKSKTENDWDKGNYTPSIYSLNKKVGKKLWEQVASVPVPVMVRYLCEFIASDVKADLPVIKSPVLILRPSFSGKILNDPANNYINPQFIHAWKETPALNNHIQIKDISNSSCFLWKDNPVETYSAIDNFISSLVKK